MNEAKQPTLWGRTKSLLGIGRAEGSWRGPFSGVGELGGFHGIGSLEDGWQRNLAVNSHDSRYVPIVYACVMAIARAISQCSPEHVRETNGRYERVTTTAAYRTLSKPNAYQTRSLFFMNLVAAALFEGNSYAVAVRNDRNEIIELHPLHSRTVQPTVVDGEIFYAVGSNPLINEELNFVVPARDMFHLRFYTPRHPLIGETPIRAAALAIGINVALSVSQAAFFSQMNRPSGVLMTDQTLTKEQMTRLREAFDTQSKLLAQGGMPILSNGLKFEALSLSNEDSQLIEAQRMSIEDICRVYGVPPPLVGDLGDSGVSSSETLVSYFMSTSLGSYLDVFEREFDRIFKLGYNEYVQLDTSDLLRTDFAGRIEALTKAVQGGLLTPNEARAREGYSEIEGGQSAYLQRQMVPIDKIGKLLDAEAERAAQTPVLDLTEDDEVEEEADSELSKAAVISLIHHKRKMNREG